MQTLSLDLGARSYPIYIGSGLLTQGALLTQHVHGKQIMIVSNTTVAPLYLEKIKSLFSGYSCSEVILPDGEQHKNLATLNLIFDALLTEKHGRTTTLIALGGGVVGDTTGFAAASYQRGVKFIQIPTTLLAQVDSSVGGKTAINHALGKNMIGAFHQPACVLIDIDTLATLPDREFRAGLAEVIKYGLITDVEFFNWLEKHLDKLLARDADSLIFAIERSCRNKAAVVAADETETGLRALLNLGHTFGHAIESCQGYCDWLHGEAIAVGMVMAGTMSCQMGLISAADAERIPRLFTRASLPIRPPAAMSNEQLIDYMQRDKKVIDGRMRLILLEAIGRAMIAEHITLAQIASAITACR